MSWVPQFVNNGHECLVVRVSEPMLDSASPDQFSAAADRHVAQRNIAVVTSSSPANVDLTLDLGFMAQTGVAEIEVVEADANGVDWLKLYKNSRSAHFTAPTHKAVWGMLPPQPRGSRQLPISQLHPDQRAPLLRPREMIQRGCDPLGVQFTPGLLTGNR